MLKPSMYLALVVVLLMRYYIVPLAGQNDSALVVDVGVIVDADSINGKISQTCMIMALEDFYAAHTNHTTRIVLHNSICSCRLVEKCGSTGNTRSSEIHTSRFCDRHWEQNSSSYSFTSNKPLSLTHRTPYFIRVAQNGSSQVEAFTSIVKAFNWREVVLIYENKDYGSSVVPHLTDALQGISTQVRHRSVLSLTATDDHILQELYKLMTMQTRVFVVHMLPTLASRPFLKAKEVGMIRKEYVWIITCQATVYRVAKIASASSHALS